MDDDRGEGAPPAHATQDWISWLLSRIAFRAASHPKRALTGALVVVSSFAGEQQRASEVRRGVRQRLVG